MIEYAIKRGERITPMGDDPIIVRQLMQPDDVLVYRTISDWQPVRDPEPRRRRWWHSEVTEEPYPDRLL